MSRKEVQDHLGNTFVSIREMCRQYNIPENRFRNRINRGWALKDALVNDDFLRKKCVDHLGNEFESQGKMCEYWNVDESVYRQRIKLGFSVEKALTKNTKNICQDHLGNTFDSMTDMCKFYNIPIPTFFTRLNRQGFSLEEALTSHKEKVYDHKGKEYDCIYDMCENYGVSVPTFRRRIQSGCSIEEALTIIGKCCNKCEDHLGNIFPNFKAMCEKWGRKEGSVRRRLKHGASLYEALESVILKKEISNEYIKINDKGLSKTVYDHIGNSFYTFNEMCEYYGLKPATVRNRLNRLNYNLEGALTKKVIRKPKDDLEKLCKKFNRPIKLVRYKLKEGLFTLEELLKNSEITRYSVKDHLGNIYRSKEDMCNTYGLHISTLKNRVNRGFSLEESLTNPDMHKISCRDHLGNLFESQTAMCKYYGIDLGRYKDRLERGYSIEEALTNEIYFQYKCTDFNGKEYHSVKDMCKAYGVSRAFYKSQLSRGLTQEEALKPINTYDHNGRAFASFKEMCLFYGISTTTFYRRKQEGMNLKEILITPDRGIKSCEDHLGNKFDSFKDMANYWNIPVNRLSARLYIHSFTLEEALTCPVRLSLGEYRIKSILDSKNITYLHNVTVKTVFKHLDILEEYEDFMIYLLSEYQREFSGFTVERLSRLRYDFTLLENNNIHSFIEFDGKQHFKFIYLFFRTLEEFLLRHNSDEIKNKISVYGNIPLLRIRYDQIDFCEEMIDDLLKNPNKYVDRHNTYLSEEEYWEDIEDMKL